MKDTSDIQVIFYHRVRYFITVYLLISTHVVIGQFSRPYSPVIGQLKFKVDFDAKLIGVLSQTVLDFYSKYKFKTFFYFNDLDTILN